MIAQQKPPKIFVQVTQLLDCGIIAKTNKEISYLELIQAGDPSIIATNAVMEALKEIEDAVKLSDNMTKLIKSHD